MTADQKEAPTRLEPGTGQKETNCRFSSTSSRASQVDVFAEINSHTIPELWVMLGLPGEPKSSGTMRSPTREDNSPSFVIFAESMAWKDHGSGEGGDGVEFVRVALRTDHAGVRDWYLERSGIDFYDHGDGKTPSRPAKAPAPPKVIQWPAELIEGTKATWKAFADRREITYAATWAMVQSGILRFTKLKDGTKCFVVTDPENRSAEIRRLDGMTFGTSKAFPLRGVNKSWPVGCEQLRHAPATASVLITEGPTDLLTAIDLYSRYRRDHGGTLSWVLMAILGAGCKDLAPDAAALIRGRHCRLVPDADEAGDRMETHWTALLREHGSSVDVVKLPRGTDLTDCKDDISPTELFSL